VTLYPDWYLAFSAVVTVVLIVFMVLLYRKGNRR